MIIYSETVIDGKIDFLDIKIRIKNNKFVTSVYRKVTFSSVYSHFEHFIHFSYKVGLLSTLIYRCFIICSNLSKFHLELERLKDIFQETAIPPASMISVYKSFLISYILRNIVWPRKYNAKVSFAVFRNVAFANSYSTLQTCSGLLTIL